MYNLAKLLTEEPKKLERLIILFIKLFLTLLLVNLFYKTNYPIKDLIENPIPKGITLSKIIYFITLMVIGWVIIWMYLDSILYYIPIGLLWLFSFTIGIIFWLYSKIDKNSALALKAKKYFFTKLVHDIRDKREIFLVALTMIRIIDYNNGNIYPNKEFSWFVGMLNNFSDNEKELKEYRDRAQQYFALLTIAFIALLLSSDIHLSGLLKTILWVMVINLYIITFIYNHAHDYLRENLEKVKEEFAPIAFFQMIERVTTENSFFKKHYKLEVKRARGRINYVHIANYHWLPKNIRIHTEYFVNEHIGRFRFDGKIKHAIRKIVPVSKLEQYHIIVSNVSFDENIAKNVKKVPGLVFVHFPNEEEFKKNLDLAVFEIEKLNEILHSEEAINRSAKEIQDKLDENLSKGLSDTKLPPIE